MGVGFSCYIKELQGNDLRIVSYFITVPCEKNEKEVFTQWTY